MSEFRVGCYLGSGYIGDDDRSGNCHFHIHVGSAFLDVPLPRILWPHRVKVVPVSWDAATIARLGRDYYWLENERRYGWYIFGNHFLVYLGRVTDDSKTEQKWSCFLPWAEWRMVRHSLYGLKGELAWTDNRADRKGMRVYDALRAAEETLPKEVFAFRDYDGEGIQATTHIEEREWWLGTGWFKWLRWFAPRKIRRSLDIEFNREVGDRKGSWKGGTLRHGINMLPGELHQGAFVRYCAKNRLVFVA